MVQGKKSKAAAPGWRGGLAVCGGVPIRFAQASVAVNIRPLNEAAAMIGSTTEAMLRMGFLLFALANSVRICNIIGMVEITSAMTETGLALFAIGLETLR